ncbi:hypothetical protein [Azospirillum sp. sgz302134]
MPTMICVVGDKGGIGKSTWARGFADLCRMRGVKTALFDADWLCRTLFRVFCAHAPDGSVVPLSRQDPRTGCVLYDIHHRELGRDFLLNSMGVPGIDIVLHDLPAGFRADFTQVMGVPHPENALREFVASARGIGVQPVFVTPLTPQWTSHQTAVWLAETVCPQAAVVAVRNEQFADDQFTLWRTAEQGRFARAGGVEIAMPGLDGQTYLNCDMQNLRLSAAGQSETLSLADKLRAASWLRRFEVEIAKAPGVLGLKGWPTETAPTDIAAADQAVVAGRR